MKMFMTVIMMVLGLITINLCSTEDSIYLVVAYIVVYFGLLYGSYGMVENKSKTGGKGK